MIKMDYLKIKRSITVSLLLILTSLYTLMAQTGSIEGVIMDRSTKEVLPGVTVKLDGTSIGAAADANGHFLIQNVKPGNYRVTASYISYSPRFMENVKVEAGKTTNISFLLSENTVTLNAVNITGVKKTNSEVSMINVTRMSPVISIAISGQQILRSQDRDASEVIRRLPGTSIIDDRFIVVRGLSQRYNTVWLNNTATPSSEADAKAFSFDVIPASMIENMVIIKSPSPELPADFSGGFVKITTVNIPEKNSFFASYGTAVAQGTTNESFKKYQGNNTDWSGFGSAFRSLPANMPSHLNLYEEATNPEIQNKISDLGKELNKTWAPLNSQAIPDQRVSLGFNKRLNLGNQTLANITSLTYSNTFNHDEIANNNYSIYDFKNDRPQFVDQFNDNQYTNSVKIGLLHNWSWYPAAGQKIEFRNLFNQIGMNRVTERTGREFYNDGRYIRSTELRYMNRSIYSGQLAGEHSLNEGTTKIDWVAGYSFSNKKEPDMKRYKYIRNSQDTTQYLLVFSDNPDLSSESQMWLNLRETVVTGAVNFMHQFSFSEFKPEIRAGIYFEDKSRNFTARNFGYAKASNASTLALTDLPVTEVFTNDNLNLINGIKLTEITSLSDSYSAFNKQFSGYISTKLPFTSWLSLYTGLRVEKNIQSLSSYKQGTSIPVNVVRDTLNLFPSANLAVNLDAKNMIRAAYGLSVNRPEFRELAPFYFVDFDLNAGIYGNPSIKQAYIHNFDLRFEHYPSQNETFNIGVFYKNFKNPIEMVIMGNSPTQYTFENVKSAYSYGIETDVRKSLGFISGAENFSIILNAALIKSKVQFGAGNLNRNRSLQGQSPYMINAGLFYYNDNNGLMITALYNIIGKRIVAVGRPSPNQWEDIPNIYELPRSALDLAISKKVTRKIEIKAGIKDVLNQRVVLKQTINTTVDLNEVTGGALTGQKNFKRDQVTKSFQPGRYFTLSIGYKF
jgi:TonB-dependent receptor